MVLLDFMKTKLHVYEGQIICAYRLDVYHIIMLLIRCVPNLNKITICWGCPNFLNYFFQDLIQPMANLYQMLFSNRKSHCVNLFKCAHFTLCLPSPNGFFYSYKKLVDNMLQICLHINVKLEPHKP